jgi:predicted RecA/RadA family phage recombinase
MKNYVESGKLVTVVAAANVTAGNIVVVGQMFGVATKTVLTGAEFEMHCGGVFDFAKLNAASMSMAAGANVYWDVTNAIAVANATNNTRIGVALHAVSNTAAKVRVRLNDSF